MSVDGEELEIFQTEVIQDFIEYKWINYAKRQYLKGFIMHTGYVISFLAYLWIVILGND